MGYPGRESRTIEAPIGRPPAGSQKICGLVELEKGRQGPHTWQLVERLAELLANALQARHRRTTRSAGALRPSAVTRSWAIHLRRVPLSCRSPSLAKPCMRCALGRRPSDQRLERLALSRPPLPPNLRKACWPELRRGLHQSAHDVCSASRRSRSKIVSRSNRVGHGEGGEQPRNRIWQQQE